MYIRIGRPNQVWYSTGVRTVSWYLVRTHCAEYPVSLYVGASSASAVSFTGMNEEICVKMFIHSIVILLCCFMIMIMMD